METDNFSNLDRQPVDRWISTATRQFDIAVNPETPDEIRHESASIAASCLLRAFNSLPSRIRRAGQANYDDSSFTPKD